MKTSDEQPPNSYIRKQRALTQPCHSSGHGAHATRQFIWFRCCSFCASFPQKTEWTTTLHSYEGVRGVLPTALHERTRPPVCRCALDYCRTAPLRVDPEQEPRWMGRTGKRWVRTLGRRPPPPLSPPPFGTGPPLKAALLTWTPCKKRSRHPKNKSIGTCVAIIAATAATQLHQRLQEQLVRYVRTYNGSGWRSVQDQRSFVVGYILRIEVYTGIYPRSYILPYHAQTFSLW